MFEHDASLATRAEIIEAAITALFDTLPKGHEARVRFLELLQAKLHDVGFATNRRHELERTIARVCQKLEAQESERNPT
jgi:hypothetical protein